MLTKAIFRSPGGLIPDFGNRKGREGVDLDSLKKLVSPSDRCVVNSNITAGRYAPCSKFSQLRSVGNSSPNMYREHIQIPQCAQVAE